MKPVSVSQINSYIKRTLGADPILSNVTVRGEISKLTFHSSGHVYFTLKDADSRLSCFLASDRFAQLHFELDEGMEILATGSVSVYEKGGTYSLNVRSIEAEGEGALNTAFEKLKLKLEIEGLFDQSLKRKLPAFPKKIGVVTSPTGAAVHDIISTVRRRDPLVDIVICPCLVQGNDAAASVCQAIKDINAAFPQLDVIIVGRGGGSKEDLWCFNEEPVARAVRASAIPVISAVGHEVDITICDLAADVRGATPTAAAELAVPHIGSFKDAMEMMSPDRLGAILENRIDHYISEITGSMTVLRSMVMSELTDREHQVRRLNDDINNSAALMLSDKNMKLGLLKAEIDSFDPMKILSRGYTVVRDMNGSWITDSKQVEPGLKYEVLFSDGAIEFKAEGRNEDGGK